MKKNVFVLALCYFSFTPLMAQNVGVGTNNPQARLEVRDTAKTKLLIASKSYLDSSQIVLSNRTASNLGTDMLISANRENGLRFTSQSDLVANNNDSILTLLPTGRVGINDPTPSERLDVNGNMNITGIIKANGNAGQPNQVLMQNSSGNLVWGDLADSYKNFDVFYIAGSGTWTVPANVTKILVEIIGAGGGGNVYGGGGGGGYIMAQLDVTPGSNINYTVGLGSAGTTIANTSDGGASSVSTGTVTLTANGGLGANYNSTYKSFTAPGGGITISPGTFRNYLSILGASGLMGRNNFIQRTASTFLEEVSGADGGGPGNCRTCTAKGAYFLFDINTATVVSFRHPIYRNLPGTGGAGGYYTISSGGYGGGNGGSNGQVIIRY